jgi:hypothetical protein
VLGGDRGRESDQEEVESLTDKDHNHCDDDDHRRHHSKRLPVRNKPVSFFGRLTKLKSQTADDRSHKVRRCLSWEHSSYSFLQLYSFLNLFMNIDIWCCGVCTLDIILLLLLFMLYRL